MKWSCCIFQIYPKSYETGYDLYKQMYYYAGPWRPGRWETREEYGIQLKASMTQNTHAKLMVWINTGYQMDPEKPVERYSACSYHSVSSLVIYLYGPLTIYVKLRVRMRRECRERFPRHRG